MKTLTLPQASMLYGNGYRLLHIESNSIVKASGATESHLLIRSRKLKQLVDINKIGTDYKIIVRKNYAITKPLRDGTIPIVECAKISSPVVTYSHDFDVELDEYVWVNLYNENSDRVIWTLNFNLHHLSFISDPDSSITGYCEQRQLFQYLESKHFQLDLPDDLCVSMEEINIKK